MHKIILNIIYRLETLRNQAPACEKSAYTKAIAEVMDIYDIACFSKAEKKDKKKSPAGANSQRQIRKNFTGP